MSRWHREHPELIGTDADPWMINESYAAVTRTVEEEEEHERVEHKVRKMGRLYLIYDRDDPERGYFTEYEEEAERESAQWTLMSVSAYGDERTEGEYGNNLRAAIEARERIKK